jgi:hypothetical protein
MPTIIRSEATALVNEVDSEWRDDWDASTLPVTATHYPPEVIVNHRASELTLTLIKKTKPSLRLIR